MVKRMNYRTNLTLAKVHKVVEKLAWITGSLSLAGVILIIFLQWMDKSEVKKEQKIRRSPGIKLSVTRPIIIKKTPATAVAVVTQPDPELIAPEIVAPKTLETQKPVIISEPPPKRQQNEAKVISRIEANPAPALKPKVTERKAVSRTEPTQATQQLNSVENIGRLFAESELNQLVGKIYAEKLRFNSNTNCVQIRITADNRNAQAISQVERFLTARNYIITGREKEDFLRGKGLKVYMQGNCVKVTIGTK